MLHMHRVMWCVIVYSELSIPFDNWIMFYYMDRTLFKKCPFVQLMNTCVGFGIVKSVALNAGCVDQLSMAG